MAQPRSRYRCRHCGKVATSVRVVEGKGWTCPQCKKANPTSPPARSKGAPRGKSGKRSRRTAATRRQVRSGTRRFKRLPQTGAARGLPRASQRGRRAAAEELPEGEVPTVVRSRKKSSMAAPLIAAAAILIAGLVLFLVMNPFGDDKQPGSKDSGDQQTSETESTDSGNADTQTGGGSGEPSGNDTSDGGDAAGEGASSTTERRQPRRPRGCPEWKIDESVLEKVKELLSDMQDVSFHEIDRRERVLRDLGAPVLPALIESIKAPDGLAAQWATRMLERLTGNSWQVVAHQSMEEREEVRKKWEKWWKREGYRQVFTRKLTPEEKAEVERVRKALLRRDSTSYDERQQARLILQDMGKELIPRLIDLLEDRDWKVVQLSEGALREFTGIDESELGAIKQELGARKPILDRWRNWWEQNKDTFEVPD